MARRGHKPTFSLTEIQALVAAGKHSMQMSCYMDCWKYEYSTAEVGMCISRLKDDHFYEVKDYDGEKADVYFLPWPHYQASTGEIVDHDLYIKLALSPTGHVAVILSFHPSRENGS